MAADGWRAFVANAVSGTVSVVEWTGVGFEETAEFAVGTEPRGCALSGSRLYVTNFTEGTVAVVDTTKKEGRRQGEGRRQLRTGSRSSATTCSSRSFSRG